MLHLFKRVYLASDSQIDTNFNRVIISTRFAIPMLQALETIVGGELLMYSSSLPELYTKENLSGFAGLITKLNQYSESSDKRIMVYVDDAAFTEFMCLWSKYIFQQPTAASSWLIVKKYIEKETRYQSWRMNTPGMLAENLFADISKDTYYSEFATAQTTPADSTYAEIKQHLSLEYLIASYLVNGSSIAELNYALKNIVMRGLQEWILEVKECVYKNAHKTSFTISYDIELFKNSSLFTSPTIGRVGSTSNIDIFGATQEDIDKFIAVSQAIQRDWEGFKDDAPVSAVHTLFEYVRKPTLTSTDIDYLINLEKFGKSNNRIYATADQEKINLYLLDYILNYENNPIQALLLK
jgi:hypothetical protein